jgi:hypothetical protein
MSSQVELPDPWRFGPGDTGDPLLRLAGSEEARPQLVADLRELLARRADAEIRRALERAPSRAVYARLWGALCAATEGAAAGEEELVVSVFAMPLVIVSGARGAAELPGTLPDPGALIDLLQRHGALGGSRNVGLGTALVSVETLEGLPPSTVREWGGLSASAQPLRELAPQPVRIRAGEEVHLRFVPGAAIAPAAAPTVMETAAHVGAWGMPLARALGAQLAAPGVELLLLPRPLAGLLRAAYAGRSAQLEVALNLFMSNTIKRTRAAAGEPTLVVSVHDAGSPGPELRVSVSAALDDTILEGYRWPLHPLDDPGAIARNVRELAADCRLTDVRMVDTLLPDRGPGGVPFVRAAAAWGAGGH